MLRDRYVSTRAVAFLFASMLALSAGCSGLNKPNVPLSSRPSFGELVYRVMKSSLQESSSCSTEYVSALEKHHTDFVTTFDYVIANGVQDNFPDLLGGTIKPFVDNDKLPELVDTMAATLALLVSDEFDPNRQTIQAMVNLSEARTLLESSIAIQTVATILVDPTIEDKIHTLATIAQENDGVTYLMDDMFDVASYALEASPNPSTCTGVTAPDAQTTLLRTDGFVEDTRYALGSPFYLARPDANGNPRVNFVNGAILPPFVDANADGAADVNADGNPIDASGNLVRIAMIGEDNAPGRDQYGRAVDDQGNLYYDYYDVKRTALSYTMQIGADLFQTKVHHLLPPIIDAVLGTPTACTDGPNCFAYPSSQNVVGDILWLVFDIAQYSRMSVFMHTLSDVFSTQPGQAEALLVALGDTIRAIDASPLQITDTTLTNTIAGMSPLLSQILTAPNTTGQSTARLVVQVLRDLGPVGDALPDDTLFMLQHNADPSASGGIGNVDLTQPRYLPSGHDNRTGVEQVAEMFSDADCGYLGPASSGANATQALMWGIFTTLNATVSGAPALHPGTVSEVLVELVGHMKSSGVANLVTLINNLNSISLVSNALVSLFGDGLYVGGVKIMPGLGCSATNAANAVAGLDSLSVLVQSGTLDWLLPVGDTFVRNGQRRTFVDIFVYITADLRKDETIGPGNSAFRKLGPVLVALSTRIDPATPGTAPFNQILNLLKLLLDIPASDGDGSAADLTFDALANMTASRTVSTRPVTGTTPGSVANSSYLQELLGKVAVLQQRVAAGGAADELSAVLDAVTPLLTTTVGSGTSRTLANPNLRLIIATFSGVIADATALPSSDYLCYIDDLQTRTTNFLNTKHFATVVRILKHLTTSPNAAGLEDWLLSMMRGNPDRSLEMYGRILQLAAGALSSNASSDDMSKIMNWLGAGLQASGAGGVREMVQTLDGLLQSDTNHAILTMARSLLAPGPLASMERPVTTYANMASDITVIDPNNMCLATGTHLSASQIEDAISGLTKFLKRDPNDGKLTGIEQVWQMVGAIAPTE